VCNSSNGCEKEAVLTVKKPESPKKTIERRKSLSDINKEIQKANDKRKQKKKRK
jgi:hypothetical protein